MPTYVFCKKAKMTKTDEFSSVFNFRKRLFSEYLVINFKPNALLHPRLGLVVGKKIAKSAVSRNYMRRVLRELFRTHQTIIYSADLVINVRKKFSRLDFIEVNREFNQLVNKMNKQLISNTSHNTQV